jgi:anthranilate phosphoribosyltransferase
MIEQFFTKLVLSKEEAAKAMEYILDEADPHQVAAILALLKFRGETSEEISGMVETLLKRATPLHFTHPVMDIVGTGGDMAHTVNISTGSAILAAACGIPIAKHGNRSVSSQSGSADVIEAFGIAIDTDPHQAMARANIAFLFAPDYHPSFKKLRAVRKGLKVPTLFNLLGPLLNPARVEYALIGVAQEATLSLMAQAATHLKRGFIFHGCGLDEITPLGVIQGYLIDQGIQPFHIDPLEFGFRRCSLKELQGGGAVLNATLLMEVFKGERNPLADSLVLNAGIALWIFEKVKTIGEGIEIAKNVQQQGKALEVLEKWKTT